MNGQYSGTYLVPVRFQTRLIERATRSVSKRVNSNLSSPSNSSPTCRPFTRAYDRAEVLADALAHTVGVVLALVGIAALISRAQNLTAAHAASVWIYCIGLITSFGISATYNMWPMCTMKMVLRRLDHSAIYFFIAATYSPFLLGTEQSVSTAVLLIGIWALALIGVTLKLVAPGRFDRVSIVLYLAMGWSAVLAYESVFSQLSPLSLSFIIAGGMLYSAGVVFHLWDQLRFQNAIWHAFVVAAAAFQYVAVFSSVLAATA